MNIQFETCLASLRALHINGIFAGNSSEAAEKAVTLIPKHSVIGLGDSSTVRSIGLPERLKGKGIRVLNPFKPRDPKIDPKEAYEYTERTSREAAICDVFLSGTNAITQDGKLVNVDAN
jgi:hypothetical protein